MNSFRQFVSRQSILVRVMALISRPVIWMLLNAESVLVRITDWYIRRAVHFFVDGSLRKRGLFRLISSYMMPYRFTDKLAKNMEEYKLPLQASFASAIFLRNANSNGLILPEWKINDKLSGRKFAAELGLVMPEIYAENYSAGELPRRNSCVIKPVEGCSANGVFVVRETGIILELNTGKLFQSWDGMLGRMKELLGKQQVRKDLWMAEEYICDEKGNPANDIKFNIFYGKLEWIAEVKRYPKMLFHMMDGKGKTMYSELYTKRQLFEGDGCSREEITLAEKISLEIPAPFMRIDFLKGPKGLYFCEFTPRPGVVGYFNRKRDQRYGQLFHQAEAKLTADLLAGKKFDAFNRVTS